MGTQTLYDDTAWIIRAVNALVAGGWMQRLTPIQQSVWLAMAKHADRDTGESYPGVDTIRRYLMLAREGRVREARKDLIKLGLLEVIQVGGGRKPMKVRMIIPPVLPGSFAAEEAARKASPKAPRPESTPPQSQEGSKAGGHPSPKAGGHPAPKSGGHPSPKAGEEQTTEQTKGQTREQEEPSPPLASIVDEPVPRSSPVDLKPGIGPPLAVGAGRIDAEDGVDPAVADPYERRFWTFVHAHPLISAHNLTEKRRAAMRELVDAVGWSRAEEYVERAIKARVNPPFDYALGIFRGEVREGRHLPPVTHYAGACREDR